jgi:hypothetical protein
MGDVQDALQRWREAERALAAAVPGSPEASRARTVLDEAIAHYQRLVNAESVEGHQMTRRRDGSPGPGSSAR